MNSSEEHQRREYQIRTLETKTIVFDEAADEPVMSIEGVLALPVGSIIELNDPPADAEVTRIRVLPGSDTHPVTVCLNVRLRTAGEQRSERANGFGYEWRKEV